MKQPPPKFKKPTCNKPPCLKKIIGVKVYIEDTLWNKTSWGGSDPTEDIIDKMENIFKGINKYLANLDNGGFMIDFDKKVEKLGNSDIVLKDTYLDRANGNVTKALNREEFWALTFAFQQSVELLKDRNAVDIRILVSQKHPNDPQTTIGLAEEDCLCNPKTFACIANFSIKFLDDWHLNTGRRQKITIEFVEVAMNQIYPS